MGNEGGEIQICIEDETSEEPVSKTVYVQLNHAFRNHDDLTFPTDVKVLTITSAMSSKVIKKHFYQLFSLDEREHVIKLRNEERSIIPFNFSVQENSIDRPYCMDVCRLYQNVTPLARTVTLPTYEQVLKKKLGNVNKRVSKLENFAPDLPRKQKIKVTEEIQDMKEKMNILERKLADADATQWQGMFKRNPLW